jgi:hypothetical protein
MYLYLMKKWYYQIRGSGQLNESQGEKELDQTILEIITKQKPKTVQQLVALAKTRLAVSEDSIVRGVLRLQNEGKIGFEKTYSQAPKLAAYLRTQEALWYWLTMGAAIATVAIVYTIPEDFYPWVYMRYVFGAIFILWLPGYSFVKALFPKEFLIQTAQKSLDAVVRVALSFVMSLALVPIAGFLLNYTPWGIRITPITLSLLAFTTVAATVAVIREHGTKTSQEHTAST